MHMTARGRQGGLLTLLAQYSPFAGFAEHIRERRYIAELGEFDDHILKDLGITRGEIEEVVRHGRR